MKTPCDSQPVRRPWVAQFALWASVLVMAFAGTSCMKNSEGGASPNVYTADIAARGEAEMMLEESASNASPAAPTEAPTAQTGGQPNSPVALPVVSQDATRTRRVIYSGSMEVQVDDPEASRNATSAFVRGVGGYVSNENQYNTTHYTVTYRVPSNAFDSLVSRVEGVADFVVSRQISANDVTAEFVDLEARLKAKKEAEQQYFAILRQATRIPDILEVQNQLRIVREEIEQVEGRLRFLSDQVSFSTLSVTYSKPGVEPLNPERSFWSRLGKGFGNGWDGVQEFLLGFFTLWPLWLITGAVWFIVRRWLARRRQAKNAQTPPTA